MSFEVNQISLRNSGTGYFNTSPEFMRLGLNPNFGKVQIHTGDPIAMKPSLVSAYLYNIPPSPAVSAEQGFPGMYFADSYLVNYDGTGRRWVPYTSLLGVIHEFTLGYGIYLPSLVTQAEETDFTTHHYNLSTYPESTGYHTISALQYLFYVDYSFCFFQSVYEGNSTPTPPVTRIQGTVAHNSVTQILDFSLHFRVMGEDPLSGETTYYALMSLPFFEHLSYLITVEKLSAGIDIIDGIWLTSFSNPTLLNNPPAPQFVASNTDSDEIMVLCGTSDFLSQIAGAVLVIKYTTTDTPPAADENLFLASIKARLNSSGITAQAPVLTLP